MDLLPAIADLSTEPIPREHSPIPGDWKTYRPCLRLDFSFTCAFCRCHESEVVERGAQGTGLFATEHFYARRSFPELANDYANCFYVCRYCNGPKSGRPVQAKDGRALLNPCQAAWNDHFNYGEIDFKLNPKSVDAAYTEDIYKLNTPRKIQSRRHRFQVISERTETLHNGPERVRELTELIPRLDAEGRRVVLEQIIVERQAIMNSRRDLERFLQVPKDAPARCRCP